MKFANAALKAACVAALLLAGGLPTGPASGDAGRGVLYLSPLGNDGWSGTLPAPSADGSDGPFASLARARDAARDREGATTIVLRGGDYYMGETLRLDARDSGTRWQAHTGEQPVLHGGLPVTDWQRTGDGLWQARVSAEIQAGGGVADLFVNGERQIAARTPNFDPANPQKGGWLFADESSSKLPKNAHLRFRSGDVPDYKTPADLKVSVFAKVGYDNNVFDIARIERKNRVLLFDNPHWRDVGPGSRYFLFGAREDLDAPGEWHFDREAGTLSYLPKDKDFDGRSVVAGLLASFIEIQGKPNDPAKDIHIEGLAFRHGSPFDSDGNVSRYAGLNRYGAVRIVNASDIVVAKSSFRALGRGVTIDGSSNVTVEGNDFRDLAATGVRLRDGVGSGATHDIAIVGNRFHKVAQLYKHDMGIHFDDSFDVRIARNSFTDLPGIAIGGGSLKNSKVGTYRFTIESNEIDRANQELNDGGAIYLIGRKRLRTGDKIRFNRISDTRGLATLKDGRWRAERTLIAYAIYLDDFASGTEIYGNVMINNLGGVHIHGGRENVVKNNIFWNSDISIQMDQRAGPEWGKNVIESNIVYTDDFDQVYPSRWNKAAKIEEANVIDRNLFWSKYPRWQDLEPRYLLDGEEKKVWSGRPGLTRAGRLQTTVPAEHFKASTSTIKLHVYGKPRRGVYPVFTVHVDGRQVGELTAARHLQTFTFEVELAPNRSHEVEVRYPKDPSLAPHHQTLFVPGLEVNGTTFAFWPHSLTSGNFERWQTRRKLDRASQLADPLFVDPEAGNFRLQSGSPAFGLGFEPLPWDRIGVGSGASQ